MRSKDGCGLQSHSWATGLLKDFLFISNLQGKKSAFPFAVIVRLVMGPILIFAAPES